MQKTPTSPGLGTGFWKARSLFGLLAVVLLLLGLSPVLSRDGVAASRFGSGIPAASSSAIQRTQHLAGLGVDRWHALGYRGRGVKVAILDSGFRGYRGHLGQA